uniref:Flavanone-3-hydroxylase 2 n=1 Tax=Silene littorea TaxID=39892 RepID=A0A142D8F3_9CARY|nr:flavanone-3-hydroxylase 2 [Silene littorea]
MTKEKATTLTELQDENCINQSFVRDEDDRPKVAYNDFTDVIPVISLSGIDSDDKRAEIRGKITEACETWGLFQVIDHGVEVEVISEMARLSTEFFHLPASEKERFSSSDGKPGSFFVSSPFKGELVQNWRETVTQCTYPIKSGDYTLWPDKPQGWRNLTKDYSDKMMDLSHKLLGLLSEALGLQTDALSKACVQMDQRVMINYYPKCPQPDLTLGLLRHTDPGTITLLYQDQVGGLQATCDDGVTWITVPPIPGALVVNLGDHSHFVSNGRFVSAEHRAVVNSNTGRLSMVTFQYPTAEARVYPLTLREGETPIMEEAISFGEMYRRKMSKDLELPRNKKLETKMDKSKLESRSIDAIFI